MVGTLNQIIEINALTKSVDAGGGVSKTSAVAFSLWAAAKNRTGQANFVEGQRQADYDYEFTCRYYSGKLVTTANTITYKGKTLKVNSVQLKDEGKLTWQIIKASYHGN